MYVIEKFQMGIYLLNFNQFLSFVADTSPAGHLASSILQVMLLDVNLL